jgi:hypothetical protein
MLTERSEKNTGSKLGYLRSTSACLYSESSNALTGQDIQKGDWQLNAESETAAHVCV